MSGTVQGPLTDLERSNYTSDSDLVKSIIYVRQDGSGTYPVEASNTLALKTGFLENGGNSDLTVDGSVTPQTFTWSPPVADGDVLFQRFQLVMVHINITDFNSFGNIPQLTNGLIIRPDFDGDIFDYANIKRNIEFTQFSTTTNSSFFAQQGNTTQNGIQFDIEFARPFTANNSTFSVDVIVQDDLTALDYFKGNVFYSVIK